jgi:16S rRNA processing protein RimM
MNLITIGKLVNTHGIRGEVKIISDFELKDQVFKKGNFLMIDKDKLEIISYRKHKNFDMVKLKDLEDINLVLKYKGKLVYVDRDSIKIDKYIKQDLIGLEVYDYKSRGKVEEVVKGIAHDLLLLKKENKNYYVPLNDIYIKQVDLDKKEIHIIEMEGLFDEN